MKRTTTLAATALMALMPLAAQAQTAPAAPAASPQRQMTPAQAENFQRGLQIMQSFAAAFKSENVPGYVKDQLFICLYARNVAQISAEVGKQFDKYPNIDRKNASNIYRIAAGLCGVKVTPAAANDAGGN